MNILLLSVSTYLSLPVLRSMDRKKYNIYLMGVGLKSRPFSRLYKKYFPCERTPEKLTKQINEICKRYDISAVIPIDLSFTLAISEIKNGLKYPVFPVGGTKEILLLSDKGKMSGMLHELNIDQPETVIINSADELIHTTLPFPFLIKPTEQDGGRGIKRITQKSDLETYKSTYSPYKKFPLLAQEFIPGQDIDLNLVAKDGVILASTVQKWNRDWLLEFIDDEEVLSVGEKIVDHLEYSGLLHIDLRRDSRTDKLRVLECNPRAWGSIGASAYAGVNFIEIGILAAQNKPIPQFRHKNITYLKPFFMISRLIKNPFSFSKFSPASKKDFINTFTDPIPYILSLVDFAITRLIMKLVVTKGIKSYIEKKEKLSYLTPIYNGYRIPS